MLGPLSLVFPYAQRRLIYDGARTALLIPDDGSGEPPRAVGARIGIQPSPTRRPGKPPLTRAATFHVLVSDCRLVQLGELDDEDARAHGEEGLEALAAWWQSEHGLLWNENAYAWRLVFEVDHDAGDRWLLPQAGRHGTRALQGYTNAPGLGMAGEPAAIDAFTQEAYARSAGERDSDRVQRLIDQRSKMAPHDRLRLITLEAAQAGMVGSIKGPMNVVNKQLDIMERRIHRAGERGAREVA